LDARTAWQRTPSTLESGSVYAALVTGLAAQQDAETLGGVLSTGPHQPPGPPIGQSETLLEYGTSVLPVLRRDVPVPDDPVAFLFPLYEATRTPEPSVSRATCDEILSSGSLGVIRNDALRRDLVDDYERIQDILRPTDFNLDRAGYRQAIWRCPSARRPNRD
jgi:hypothetical protein